VREYAGRALKNVLSRVEDERVLNPVVEPLARALAHEAPRTRLYAAVTLAALVPKIRDEATLMRAVPLLAAAKRKDPDAKVREYAGRALSRMPRKGEEPKTRPRVHSF
jgi:HEAT repeat protein